MLTSIANVISGTFDTSHRSVVLTLEAFPEISALHIVPEDGLVEFIDYLKSSQFNYSGTKERSREQLGSLSLRVRDGETPHGFLEEVSQRVKQDLDMRGRLHEGKYDLNNISQVLRSAIPTCIYRNTEQESTLAAAQSYPLFLVQIDRAKPGRIVGEPKSIASG